MKQLKLMKTLLVAVCLLAGASNAWGQIATWTHSTESYVSNQELSPNTGVISVKLGNGTWTRQASLGIYVNDESLRTPIFTDNIPTEGGYIVIKPTRTLNFSLTTYSSGNNCNLVMVESTAPTVYIQDFRQKQQKTNDFGTLEAGKTYYIYGINYKNTTWTDYVFYQSFTATTIENYTIHFKDGSGNTIKSDAVYEGLYGATVTASAADMVAINYNDKTYAYQSGNQEITLGTGANEITLVFAAASVADVTLKYEDIEGNSLSAYQADQVISGVVLGTEISSLITETYTTTFYNGESNKYIYANSYVVTGAYTTVQEGGNTVTLKFTNYPATAYTVTGMCGSTNLGTIASGTAYLDGSTTAYWSKYVYKEAIDTWYETTSPYGKAVTKASEDIEYSTSGIDYFFECENTTFNSAGTTTGTSYSNGTTVTLAQNGAMATKTPIAAGTYNVSVYNTVRRSNEDQLILQYSTDGTNWEDLGQTLTFPSNNAATQTATITLAAESYLRFKEPNVRNSCHNYDYITLTDVVKAAIADCKAHEASSEFATYIDGEKAAGRLSTANDVYAAHTAWQIAQADAASSNDITKAIFDAGVSDFSRWNDARSNSGQQYTGAPDNKYFDAYDKNVSDASQTIYGLPAGTYTIKVATRSSETLVDVNKNSVWVYDGAATTKVLGNHIGNAGGCLGNGWNWTIIPFTVSEKANVSIGFYSLPGEGTGLWAGADDWHLYKGELTESVTVTDAGFATYASDCALDFSETAIKAYKVKVTKEGDADPVATLTKVNQVPAGTPVLLYKEGGDTNDVPVIANADAVSDNDLVRGTGAAVETTEDTYTNMILNNVGGNIGFYFANGKKVEKNRAYLHILTTNAPAAAGARMTIVFDEESTGIQKIESEAANKENGAYYNLSGQRVAQPTKGLYIVNGKKVVIK